MKKYKMNIYQKRLVFDNYILLTCFEQFERNNFTVPDMKATDAYDKLNHIYQHVLKLGNNRNLLHDWGKYKSIHSWIRRSKPNIKEHEKIKNVIPFQVVADDETIEKKRKELLLTKLVMD